MPHIYSTRNMVLRLIGLLGTDDLNDFERSFVASMHKRLEEKTLTEISERQVMVLERIFDKHFA